MQTVYAFDRLVLPLGTQVQGHISKSQRPSGKQLTFSGPADALGFKKRGKDYGARSCFSDHAGSLSTSTELINRSCRHTCPLI
jgi:hypothetical protein